MQSKLLLICFFVISISSALADVREFPEWSDTIPGASGVKTYASWGDGSADEITPVFESLCGGKVQVYWPPGGTIVDPDYYPTGLQDPSYRAGYDGFFRNSGDTEGGDPQLIREYICDIVAVYESRVGVFPGPLRIFIIRAISINSSPDAPTPADSECELFNTEGTVIAAYDPETKAILVPTGISDTSIDPCPYASLAHEVGHWLIDHTQSRLSETPWLDEGGAEYLSSLVFTEGNYPQCYTGRYQAFGAIPYTPPLWPKATSGGRIGRSYDGYPFLHYLADELGDDRVISTIMDAAKNETAPAEVVGTLSMFDRNGEPGTWLDYIQEVWGDSRYSWCGEDLPYHNELEFTKEDNRKQIELFYEAEDEFSKNQCYAADYVKLTSEEDGAIIYKLHTEQVYGENGIDGAKDWFKLGAMVKNQNGEWRTIDVTGREFVQFEKVDDNKPDDITDDRALIYHRGKEVGVVFSLVPQDPDQCDQLIPQLKDKKFGVHFGLNNTWQLKQIRIGEGEDTKKVNVIGLMYLRTEEKDGKKYILQKSRRFWPNFETKDFYRIFKGDENTENKAVFKSPKSLELYIETACYFAGTQIFEIQATDDTKDIEQQLFDPETWEERLEYELKSHEILMLNRPHHFRCDPTRFTSKLAALSMLGGGMASAAATFKQETGWLKYVTAEGEGVVGDSWAKQLDAIFTNALTWGFGENEGKEDKIALKFVPSNETREKNYLVVKVHDELHLIYQEVIR